MCRIECVHTQVVCVRKSFGLCASNSVCVCVCVCVQVVYICVLASFVCVKCFMCETMLGVCSHALCVPHADSAGIKDIG